MATVPYQDVDPVDLSPGKNRRGRVHSWAADGGGPR